MNDDDEQTGQADDTAIRAEVATELEATPATDPEYPDGTTAVPLGEDGAEVHILPVEEWSATAQEDLSLGRFNSWAEDALAGDDYDTIWCELRDGRGPTVGQINRMFGDWSKATGNTAGKSRAARRSFERTRRR